MDFNEIIVSTVGLALTIGLTYYSVRTIGLFKNNVAARAWVYISLSAIFFGLGVVMFLVAAIFSAGLINASGECWKRLGPSFCFSDFARTSCSGRARTILLELAHAFPKQKISILR